MTRQNRLGDNPSTDFEAPAERSLGTLPVLASHGFLPGLRDKPGLSRKRLRAVVALMWEEILVCMSWTKLGAANALIRFSTLRLLFFIPFNKAPMIPASIELLGGGGGGGYRHEHYKRYQNLQLGSGKESLIPHSLSFFTRVHTASRSSVIGSPEYRFLF